MNMTFDLIKLRGSHAKQVGYNTSWKTRLPWAGKTRNMGWQILLQKIELLSSFCNNVSQPT